MDAAPPIPNPDASPAPCLSCAHCRRYRATRPASLCRRCFASKAVRKQYGAQSPPCIHCGIYRSSRPRKLCRKCHQDPAIRQQYTPVSPHGCRMPRYMCRAATRLPSPDSPTAAVPGTADKIRVLAERIAARVELWRRDDAIRDPEGRAAGDRSL